MKPDISGLKAAYLGVVARVVLVRGQDADEVRRALGETRGLDRVEELGLERDRDLGGGHEHAGGCVGHGGGVRNGERDWRRRREVGRRR